MEGQDDLQMLTIKQLAARTGVAEWRWYQLFAAGKGPPHVRFGRTIRVRVADAKQWLDEQTHNQ